LAALDGAARRWLHDLLARGGAALEAIDDGPLRGSWRLAMR